MTTSRPYAAYICAVKPWAVSLPVLVTANGAVSSVPGATPGAPCAAPMPRSGPERTVTGVSASPPGAVSVASGPPVASVEYSIVPCAPRAAARTLSCTCAL
ncbi:hypothetical protein AB0I51_18695 [Streptomyces sp. NPDC050549]|uniref:hypothetical protein n=1 Tax=Streptomyces sp. NPDC050549 TaxID=3155406 RepID=UPI00344542A4